MRSVWLCAGPDCERPRRRAGVGGVGVAAARLGRRFLGFEINQKYCDIANARISRELAQGTLDL